MLEKRTDLAVEVRESFPRDNVEIKGVILEKEYFDEGNIRVSTVEICDERGSRAMKKPIGKYITLESEQLSEESERGALIDKIREKLAFLYQSEKNDSILVAGLGNREVTSDSLGPKVMEALLVTRHIQKEFGTEFMKENKYGEVSAIAPGVMAQTGMEAVEILEAIVSKIKPDRVIVIDALAARSLSRLCTTVQLTDVGICPGSGVGNHRKELSKKSLGVPVYAIGVPTVVDAKTIISDHMEHVLEKQGYSEHEIGSFLNEMFQEEMEDVFVTPKNIDESIRNITALLADVLNESFHNQ